MWKNIIVGLVTTTVGGVIVWWLTTDDPEPPPPEKDPEIHFQELNRHQASSATPIRDVNGRKQRTRVFAYLDLDDGRHNQDNVDVMLTVPFFSDDLTRTVRSTNSDLVETSILGQCGPIDLNPEGSLVRPLQIEKPYCVKTNKGRIASFVVHRILTSWGKYANIDVQVRIMTYDVSFSG